MSKKPIFAKLKGQNNVASLRDCLRDYFVELIRSGQLPAGALLPPTRDLSQQFGVSRDTVVRAYQELQRLCYIESSSTRGFVVNGRSAKLPPKAVDAETSRQALLPAERLSKYGQSVADRTVHYPMSSDFPGFNYGGPPLDLLPVRTWKERLQFFGQSLGSINHRPELLGRPELRQAVAAFLGRNKQIQCCADAVSIFTSSYGATGLLCRLLLNPGDTIAVEDPGYGGIRNIAAAQRFQLLPIPVDSEGMCVDAIAAQEQNVRLVYVTPLNQEPTGARLSDRRREKLLQWAKATGAWIIEDDFDGYFSCGKPTTSSLRALDDGSSVIYLSTFWRLLYPLTSLGFCLLPEPLTQLVERSKLEVEGISETIPQLALASIIEDGYLERFVRKLGKEYALRRRTLIFNLKKSLNNRVQIIGDSSGTQCLVAFPEHSAQSVLKAASNSGFPLISTSPYYLAPNAEQTFLIDFSCLTADQLIEQTRMFANHL